MSAVSLVLREWETLGPGDDDRLAGLTLNTDPATRALIDGLAQSGRLELLELARGLEIRASSWVGRVALGEVTITIEPKLTGAPLLRLMRYAYALRDLLLFDRMDHATSRWSFEELLVHQLAAEVTELLGRGLHRDYQRRQEGLASPRGRIDFGEYVSAGGGGRTTLPCEHYPRTEDGPLNQAMLAGLRFAVGRTDDLMLRTRLRRLIQQLEGSISAPPLNGLLLVRAKTALDRRTHSYRATLTLIELLLQSVGTDLDNETSGPPLSGFLFDMNRFFQALLSRFLDDHLNGFTLRNEHRLRGMFVYDPTHNPRSRRAPTPRPDFVVLEDGAVVSILDAKYRDIWERPLPREMLYQLTLYALSQENLDRRRAIILYPTLNASAVDQVVNFSEPLRGATQATVTLRPVNLLELAESLGTLSGGSGTDRRRRMAHAMVFGIR